MLPNHTINFVPSNTPQQIVFVQPIQAIQPVQSTPTVSQILTQSIPLTTAYVMLSNPMNQNRVLQNAYCTQTPLASPLNLNNQIMMNNRFINRSNILWFNNGCTPNHTHTINTQINTINRNAPCTLSLSNPTNDLTNNPYPLDYGITTTPLRSIDSNSTSNNNSNASTNPSSINTPSDGFICDQCHRVFVRKVNLNAHKKIHTAFAYVCTFCNKKFARKSNLEQHIRIHTDERPYHCTYCPRTFRQQHSLKGHLRTHTGEKPYECQYCTKRFAAKCNLKVHLRTHTGEKPYQCVPCNKGYASKSGFNAHQRKFHPNE